MKESGINVLAHSNSEKVIEKLTKSQNGEYPFYVCDINDIIFKYKLWKKLFPRIQPHYAVKSNNHPVVLQVLESLGVNFDCASKDEIEQVISLGVHASRIIFSQTSKPSSSIKYAQEHDVRLMTFDTEDELYKIKENFPNAQVVIRIQHADASEKCNINIGCNPFTEAEELLKIASKENINVVGVSFQLGFGSKNPREFYESIRDAYYVSQVALQLGFSISVLDIGGGYPGTYEEILITYSENISKGLEDFFPNLSVQIIAEPGTFFVKTAFTLACCVQIVKAKTVETSDHSKAIHYEYHINDGVFGSFPMIAYNHAEYTPISLKAPSETLFQSTVWGPTCASMDKVSDNVLLPKMKTGDWMIFKDTGNYTHVLCSNFNGLGLKKIFNIISYENMLKLRKKWPVNYTEFVTTSLDET